MCVFLKGNMRKLLTIAFGRSIMKEKSRFGALSVVERDVVDERKRWGLKIDLCGVKSRPLTL